MSKYAEIFSYMMQCPQLADLWSIAATEELGNSVILPQGASDVVQYQENTDVNGCYECTIEPYPSVFEDYQINCFRFYDVNDNSKPEANINVLTLDDVQSICDWVEEQNGNNNFPTITDKNGKRLNVVSVECRPINPQIRYVNQRENIIAYFITLRVRYVNTRIRKQIEYGIED